jgi:hypothetical protein
MRDNLSFRLGQDPGVACLSYCALALWVLGYPDQAKRTTLKAVKLADGISHQKAYPSASCDTIS